LHSGLNIRGGLVDLFLLILHGDLDGGRLRTNFLQKGLRRVKLGGERIPVFLISSGRWWLEMREKVFLILI